MQGLETRAQLEINPVESLRRCGCQKKEKLSIEDAVDRHFRVGPLWYHGSVQEMRIAGEYAMKFAVVVYETQEDFALRSNPATVGPYMAAYMAYSKALAEAGVADGGAGLHPPATATSIRIRDGKQTVQDGPFIESKEQVGGFFLLNVPDLETALKWAAKCPSASSGGVEVRAVLSPPPSDHVSR